MENNKKNAPKNEAFFNSRDAGNLKTQPQRHDKLADIHVLVGERRSGLRVVHFLVGLIPGILVGKIEKTVFPAESETGRQDILVPVVVDALLLVDRIAQTGVAHTETGRG